MAGVFGMENFGLEAGFDGLQGQDPAFYRGLPALEEVRKAMDAGHAVPSYSGGGTAAPLFRQEIIDQLIVQTENPNMARFWNQIWKNSKPANNTVVEYRKQTGVGDAFANVTQAEGSAGPTVDSTFTTHYQKMRWIAEQRSMSMAAELIANSLAAGGTIKSQMVQDANTHISNRLEHMMFYGDSVVNTYSIDGLKKFVADAVTANLNNNAAWQVVDKRGDNLSMSEVGMSQVAVHDNVFERLATQLWAPTMVGQIFADEHGDRVKAFYSNGQEIPRQAGAAVRQILTQMGQVDVNYSYYLSPTRKLLTHVAATSLTAPAAPTMTSITAAPDAASKFITADAATYNYSVVAVGNTLYSGASAPTDCTPTAVQAGDKVTLVISATGNTGCQFYNIYRDYRGAGSKYLIGQVACAGGSSTTTFVDYNEEIPGTADAFLLDPSPDVVMWREMMPYSMIPLPQVQLTRPFAFALFGCAINGLPALVRFKNVKCS